jgi:HD superfamily phosphohydrolase
MERLNQESGGSLTRAISIFENTHPQPFLHQLVSSQLDMDRMDYLNRDSFYTGVSEGVIGYDRILQMLTVHNDSLVVEEKGIHSVEKFIIARRLMYWQVYLHKTVLGAEQLIINILKRAKELALQDHELFATPALRFFLYEEISKTDFESNPFVLSRFCRLDDDDILSGIKVWAAHKDAVLSRLCKMLLNRDLYKVRLSTQPLHEEFDAIKKKTLTAGLLREDELPYFLFSGTTSNSTYNQNDEQINILLKTGGIISISRVDNALINALTSQLVRKYYYCGIEAVFPEGTGI